MAACCEHLISAPLAAPAGIDAPTTQVMVTGHKHNIDLHSPLPDGSITDFKGELKTIGGLAREPAGVIRTFEMYQLHLVYAWRTLLASLDGLTRW